MSKASREVANLTERKNPHTHTPLYDVNLSVRLYLSVCLLQTLTSIISGLAEFIIKFVTTAEMDINHVVHCNNIHMSSLNKKGTHFSNNSNG